MIDRPTDIKSPKEEEDGRVEEFKKLCDSKTADELLDMLRKAKLITHGQNEITRKEEIIRNMLIYKWEVAPSTLP